MKIIPLFTHPQAILGVYDFLLSAKHNHNYNGSVWYHFVKIKKKKN